MNCFDDENFKFPALEPRLFNRQSGVENGFSAFVWGRN